MIDKGFDMPDANAIACLSIHAGIRRRKPDRRFDREYWG
jgi:hypothetical protein